MYIKKNNDISNTEINLAINYRIIETAIRLMDIEDFVYSEHPAIEVVIKEAKIFKLHKRFTSYSEGNDDDKLLFTRLLEEMQSLFGLPIEVLTGERQINLGVSVDKADKVLFEISKKKMNELANYFDLACKKVISQLTSYEFDKSNKTDKDTESDELEVEGIFGLSEGLKLNENIQNIYDKKTSELEGVAKDVWFNEWSRLIGLDGIIVDLDKAYNKELYNTKLEDPEVFLERHSSDGKLSVYKIINIVDYIIANSIQGYTIPKDLGIEFLVNSLYYNPLGLNYFAIFNHIFKTLSTELDEKSENSLEDIFKVFNFYKILDKHVKTESAIIRFNRSKSYKDAYDIFEWLENAYSVQSIIYNILINTDSIYETLCKRHISSDLIQAYTITKEKYSGSLPYPLILNAEKSELISLINSLHNLYFEAIVFTIKLLGGRSMEKNNFVLYSEEIKRCKYAIKEYTITMEKYKLAMLKYKKALDEYDEDMKKYEEYKDHSKNPEEQCMIKKPENPLNDWAKQYALQLFREKKARTKKDNYIPGRDNPQDDIDRWFANYTKLIPIKKAREKIIAHKMENEYKEIMDTKEKEIKIEFLKSFDQWLFFMEYTEYKPYIISKYPDYTEGVSLKSPEEEEYDRKKAERARAGKKEHRQGEKLEEPAKSKQGKSSKK